MTFGAVWSRRLNFFLSQSAYAFNLSNFFALNLIACGQVLEAIYTDRGLSKMSEYELSRNVFLAVHLFLRRDFFVK